MVSQEELFLGKLLALLDRGAARDVWDTAHLPDKACGRLAADSFRKLFIALSVVLERPLPTYSRERLERQVTERIFTEQVAPLLNVHIDFMASDLLGRAWAVVGRFLVLGDDEKAYLESADLGDLNLELIFPDDPQEAERIAGHPAIQWKMANVRAHRKRTKG
jgi:hypothetical protein